MRLHSVYSASFCTDYISVRAVFPLQKPHIHRLKFAVIRYTHYILNRMYCPCPQSAELSRQKGGKPIFPNCFGGRLPPFFGCRIQREPYPAVRLDTAHFGLIPHISVLYRIFRFYTAHFCLIPHISAFSPMPSIRAFFVCLTLFVRLLAVIIRFSRLHVRGAFLLCGFFLNARRAVLYLV